VDAWGLSGHIREIGVRELKGSLSETLRAVGRGEQVRVTIRGRPVADIVPAGVAAGDDRIRGLVAEGRVVPPSKSRPPRAPRLAKGRGSASPLVLGERDAER
jgi:prevent-host-death family protein